MPRNNAQAIPKRLISGREPLRQSLGVPEEGGDQKRSLFCGGTAPSARPVTFRSLARPVTPSPVAPAAQLGELGIFGRKNSNFEKILIIFSKKRNFERFLGF